MNVATKLLIGTLAILIGAFLALGVLGGASFAALPGTVHAIGPVATSAASPIQIVRPEGFSFDVPAGWVIYYPDDHSMMDKAVVTVASTSLLPPCPSDACQRFTTPPATVAVEFRVGSSPGPGPNWIDAPTTIGGAPAFREDWGPQNATGADEGHTWNARLANGSSLIVSASLRGPNVAGLQQALNGLLASLRVAP